MSVMASRTLTVGRDVQALDQIVEATEAFFSAEAVDPGLRYLTDLVIEELFVNCVKYNLETTEDIIITLKKISEGIEVDLTDRGVERFDPTAQPAVDIDRPLEDRTPGGLGVFLVMKMVDRISYQFNDGVSTISFRKYSQ